MAAAPSNNNPTQNNNAALPEHFDVFKKGATFTCSEDAVKQQITSILQPYGVYHLNFGDGTRGNKDGSESTKQMFPHKRWIWVCGSCEKRVRNMDDSERGCCGLKIRFLLRDKEEDKQPYLEVMEFKLPPTSNHLLVSEEVRQSSESKVINSAKDLTPKKVKLLENMGKNRTTAEMARSMLYDQHQVIISKNLLHRIMQQGRDMAWGGNETESLTIFCSEGSKIREYCPKFGVSGKFDTVTHNTTGKLIGWYAQHPLEVLNARAYAKDGVFVDTTHNATKYSFKTGPPAVVDCFGHSTPCGMFQVPEEEIDSVASLLKLLELDVVGATCCTDGGAAWSEVARKLGMHHIEDTWHNNKNGDEKAAVLTDRKIKKEFGDLKTKVLYAVLDQQKLSEAFCDMRALVSSSKLADDATAGLRRWIDRVDDGQSIRTATHTTKYFSCSQKGALSRCEQMMSKLKNSGTNKKEMKNWTLGELQNRHQTKVRNYETEVTEEIETAIKEKRDLSHYILEWESKERTHVDGLEIVEAVEGVPNPFRLQSTKREMQTINLEKPECGAELGLTWKFCSDTAEELCPNLEVTSILESSIYRNSTLEVGMRIYSVNGTPFTTLNDGVHLIKSAAQEELKLDVEMPAAVGTVYTIQRKGKGEEQAMRRTVFVPDSDDLHCQSDFHVHTCSFIRCRYIQRALIEHKTRSMRDLSTIHSRWHVKNSPLYKVVYNNLVALMKIDGLGANALPAFLNPTTTPSASAHAAIVSAGAAGNADEGSIEAISQKVVVPNSKARRFNEANFVAKPILELARKHPEVFRMVMPQFQQMYQNSLMLANSKSTKVVAAKNQLAATGASLPILHEALGKRDKSDETNLANNRKKRKKAKKTRAKSTELQHDQNGDSRHDLSAESDSDDDDNVTLADLKKGTK